MKLKRIAEDGVTLWWRKLCMAYRGRAALAANSSEKCNIYFSNISIIIIISLSNVYYKARRSA
jgi:hypothetical protein